MRSGERLRAIRQRWQLSLRDVEERSLRFAQERGSESHQVSATWLVRLEREEHELAVNKLIALADIYNIPAEELLHSIYPESPQPYSGNSPPQMRHAFERKDHRKSRQSI
jgi:transcriptional regulator with XRE-family HTH domain